MSEPGDHIDLTACEQEPLAWSGLVQSAGALFVVSADGRVTHGSENLATLFDLPGPGNRLQLADLFIDDTDYFEYRIETFNSYRHRYIHSVLTNRGIEGNLTLGPTGASTCYEFEPLSAKYPEAASTVSTETVEGQLPAHIDMLKVFRDIYKLAGYGKIMCYRFLEDDSGEVIAELSDGTLDSYLGLRFPSSDIPKIARDLYLESPFRLIFDVDSQPVPVHSLVAGSGPVDLTYSVLRSVSPVHITYLKNMGVRSSASFPIRIMGKLWGLISLHSTTSLPIVFGDRLAICKLLDREVCEPLVRQMLAERQAIFDTHPGLRKLASAAVRELFDQPDSFPSVLQQLTTTIANDAAIVLLDGKPLWDNKRVSATELRGLRGLAQQQAIAGIFTTNSISRFVPQDDDFRVRVSGMLYFTTELGKQGRLEFFWLRKEARTSIEWAGEPVKETFSSDGHLLLSPRRSFKKYIEMSEAIAKPWSSEEKLCASTLRAGILQAWLDESAS